MFKRTIPFLLIAVQALACTGIQLKAKDGSIVHGRTLEFGTKILFSAGVVPRNYSFFGTTPLGKGLEYESKYGAVGAILFNEPAIADGMNEKGLCVGTFYFPGFAQYVEITPENRARALSPTEFPNWIVTQFENVEEIKEAIDSVVIAQVQLKAWGNMAPPFHYIVYDQSGGCIVIEPIGGKLVITDNPFGVMTNSPAFDGILQTFHVLNQFDIPKGIAREVDGKTIHADYTMVTCARDPQSLKYYFKTYEDQTILMIDLNAFDLDETKIKKMTP